MAAAKCYLAIEAMRHYFAYGSNMIASDMKRRAPDAIDRGNAKLDDFKFVLAQSGYASIAPSRGSRVYGVLWQISADDERTLDEYEGVHEGLYRKEEHRVGDVMAMMYVETSGVRGRALLGYLETILHAAQMRGFPEDYMRELRALRYNPDVE